MYVQVKWQYSKNIFFIILVRYGTLKKYLFYLWILIYIFSLQIIKKKTPSRFCVYWFSFFYNIKPQALALLKWKVFDFFFVWYNLFLCFSSRYNVIRQLKALCWSEGSPILVHLHDEICKRWLYFYHRRILAHNIQANISSSLVLSTYNVTNRPHTNHRR